MEICSGNVRRRSAPEPVLFGAESAHLLAPGTCVPASWLPSWLPPCHFTACCLLPSACCLLPIADCRFLGCHSQNRTFNDFYSIRASSLSLSLSPSSSAMYRAIVRSRILHAQQSFVSIRCHCCVYNSAEDHYTEGKSRHIKQQREGANIMWADSGWRVMGSKGNLKDKTKFYRAALKHDS